MKACKLLTCAWVMKLSCIVGCLLLVAGCKEQNQTAQSVAAKGAQKLIPIIDSHVHITPTRASVERALAIFDKNGITRFCTKSAGFAGSRRFFATVQLKKQLKDRFAFFANLDWQDFDSPNWGAREAARLEKAVQLGARGIKIFKNLGLSLRTNDGKLVKVDDPRLDPVMKKAAQLGAIVAIHTSDPKAFFKPPGPKNERYLELLFAPSWSFYGGDFPSRDELLAARDRLIARHPKTLFLGIHLANNPEDLDYVDRLLEKYPNLYVDTAARLGEIGRHQKESVRSFFIKHQDRILFGTDIIVGPSGLQLGSLSIWPDDDSDADTFYQAHREFFETGHKHIDHPTPIQGNWKIDGIDLPQDVLEKIYIKNAEKLIWEKS